MAIYVIVGITTSNQRSFMRITQQALYLYYYLMEYPRSHYGSEITNISIGKDKRNFSNVQDLR
jgi:hypothetical protein